MRTKIFHPEHEKFKPIFKRKPNQNQKKNFKIQTQTQPQTETKFSKTKPKRSLKFSKLNPNPRANPIEKKNKFNRNKIENEIKTTEGLNQKIQSLPLYFVFFFFIKSIFSLLFRKANCNIHRNVDEKFD